MVVDPICDQAMLGSRGIKLEGMNKLTWKLDINTIQFRKVANLFHIVQV